MFEIGDDVWKEGAGYAGPGVIVGKFSADDGSLRYNVSHKIEGGRGRFIHIYTATQLRPLSERQGTKKGPAGEGGGS